MRARYGVEMLGSDDDDEEVRSVLELDQLDVAEKLPREETGTTSLSDEISEAWERMTPEEAEDERRRLTALTEQHQGPGGP